MSATSGYERPGRVVYLTAASDLTHGQAVKQSGFVGQAIKQAAPSWQTGYSAVKTIATDEDYALRIKGVVCVPSTGISSPAVGDAVYITSGNALTKTSSSNTAFGRIVGVAGSRGVPTGFVRIDLDAKDSI